MNIKITVFWLNLLLVLSFFVIIIEIAPVVEAPTIIYVDDVPGFGPGNPEENYTKIQDAINASKDGDTVYVYNGTYYENVVVNISINLTGENKDTTIIDGKGNGNVTKIEADWVNITGFNITNGEVGIYLNSSSNININRNNILNNNIGIFQISSSNNSMTLNNISNNDEGIYFIESTNNTISYNNVIANHYGISLDLSVNNIIKVNNVSHNTWHGIDIIFSSNNIIKGNKAFNNGISISNGCGIKVMTSSNNNIVSGNNISRNDYGIMVWSSSNNTIITNNLSLNNDYGIYLGSNFFPSMSDNNTIIYNNVSSNYRYGIYLLQLGLNNNTVIGNNISNNTDCGIVSSGSININITANYLVNNGVYIYGTQVSHYNTHTIPNNNMVNGNPLYYYKDYNSININGIPIGQLIIANCTDFNVENLQINHTDVGILIAYSTKINIINNSIHSNNRYGIHIDKSSNNTITNSNVSLNNYYGIYLRSSSHNNITFNKIISNFDYGIYLWDSTNNNVSNNIVLLNYIYGIRLAFSSNNSIFHNSIVGNTNQAYDDSNKGNKWDNGYPLGGNYWSDYGGVDNFKGPNQDIPGSDGIGDTNYSIDSDSVDNYPLMQPYIPLENYTILRDGWNLISIPLIQVNKNLTKVLEMIDGWYDAVQWYDITDPNDPWKHHKVGKPFGNDLFELNETMGFWVHITQLGDTIFLYNGTQPTVNQTIALNPGWNLVGYPSITSYNRTAGLNNLTFGTHVDSIWTYNAVTQKWKEIGPSDYFEIGKGYWVHAKTECVWEVPL